MVNKPVLAHLGHFSSNALASLHFRFSFTALLGNYRHFSNKPRKRLRLRPTSAVLLQSPRLGHTADSPAAALSRAHFPVDRFQVLLTSGRVEHCLTLVREAADGLSQDLQLHDTQVSRPPPAVQRYLLQRLHGRHQPFFGACLRARRLEVALQYVQLLEPAPSVFAALLQECQRHGGYSALQQAIQVIFFQKGA